MEKKRSEWTARVERIASNGAGVLTYDGRKFFADNTAPQDLVTVRACEKYEGFAEILEINEPSPLRVSPLCGLAGRCGGCSLQHLSYNAQIAEKENILREDFIRIGHFEKDFFEKTKKIKTYRHPSGFSYRNRVQFHRVKAGVVGFKARRSDEIIGVSRCPVCDECINRALAEKRIVPPVEKDRFTVYAYQDTFLTEGRNERGAVTILDRRIALDAGVFFQSNALMLEFLIKDILDFAKTADTDAPAADIYAGVGTFALFLQNTFPKIAIVEENKKALTVARDNVGKNAEYFALSADKWANSLKKSKKKYGFIIADPPRQGLSSGFRELLCKTPPALFAYVSCDPSTLARDAAILTATGYELSSLAFYDFYPQTPHLETLALFQFLE